MPETSGLDLTGSRCRSCGAAEGVCTRSPGPAPGPSPNHWWAGRGARRGPRGRATWLPPTPRRQVPHPHRPSAPSCWTPRCCCPTRTRCCGSTSTRWSSRWSSSPNWRPNGITRNSATSLAPRCACSTSSGSLHGRLDAPLPVGEKGGTLRVELNHTDPETSAGRFPARRQRQPHPRGGLQLPGRGPRRHAGLEGPADAGQGVGLRPGRRGVPRRADAGVRLDRDGRARGRDRATSTSCTRTACWTCRAAGELPDPHRAGAAVRAAAARSAG